MTVYNPIMGDGSLQYREEVYDRFCAASSEFSRVAEALLAFNSSGTLLAAVDRSDAVRFIAVIDRYLSATREVVSAAVKMTPENARSYDEQIRKVKYIMKTLEQAT